MALEDTSNSHPPTSPAVSRRRAPRYEFVATIELRDKATSTRLSGRVAEISLHGCYVDCMNSLPVGTDIKLRISRDQAAFETLGKIVYVQANLGMGIAFVDAALDQLQILEAWVAELSPL